MTAAEKLLERLDYRAESLPDSGSEMTAAEKLLERLDRVRQTGPDSWLASCPAHDDKSPSLSIRQTDDRLLIHCFAGCPAGDVTAAVGLELKDLYDRPLNHNGKPLSHRQRRRYGQAQDALKVIDFEARVVMIAAHQMAAGYGLADEDYGRLHEAWMRIHDARRVAA